MNSRQPRVTRRWGWIWLLLCLACSGQGVFAATAKLEPSTANPEAGEPFLLTLTLDEQGGEVPQSLNVPGLDAQLAGQRIHQQASLNGGQVQMETHAIYQYQAVAQKEGSLTIPEIEIVVGGQKVRTAPLSLNVAKAGSVPRPNVPRPGGAKPWQQREAAPALDEKAFFVRVEPERKEIYVGETVEVKIKAYVDKRLSMAQFERQPGIQGEHLVFQSVLGPDAEMVQRGLDRGYQFKEETIDGRTYVALTYRTAVSSVKPGDFTIDPVKFGVTVLMPMERLRPRSFFGNDFPFDDGFFGGAMSMPRELRAQSEPVPLKVLPLPKEGMPEDFKGAVGRFSMDVKADKTEVEMDKPLTLTTKLTGHGNFERINEVTAISGDAWKAYPAKSEFRGGDDLNLSGEKTFEQTFLAAGPGMAAPSVAFSYFDPTARKYVTLRAPEIPVKITGAEKLAVATERKDETPKSPSGSWSAPPLVAAELSRGAWPRPFSPSFCLANGAAFLLVAGLAWRAWARKNQGSQVRRKRAALKREQAALLSALRAPGISRRTFAEKTNALLALKPNESYPDSLGDVLTFRDSQLWSRLGDSDAALDSDRQRRYAEALETWLREEA